jgi:hypothetical protein
MGLITQGYVDNTIVTRGMGLSWIRRVYRKAAGFFQKKETFLTLEIIGNTSIPFSVLIVLFGSLKETFSEILSFMGNNNVKIKDTYSLNGNLRSNKQLILSQETKGRKGFKQFLMELLFDEDE